MRSGYFGSISYFSTWFHCGTDDGCANDDDHNDYDSCAKKLAHEAR